MARAPRQYVLYAVDDRNQHMVVPVETKDLQDFVQGKEITGNTYLAVIDNLTTSFANKKELTASLQATKQLKTTNKIVDYYICYFKQKKKIKMELLFNQDRQMVNKFAISESNQANRSWVKFFVEDLIYNTCDNPLLKDDNWHTYSPAVMANRSLLLDFLVEYRYLSGRYTRTSKLSIAEKIDLIAENKKVVPQYTDRAHELAEIQERIRTITDEIIDDVSSSYKLARGIYIGVKKFKNRHKDFNYDSRSGFDTRVAKSPFVTYDMPEKTFEERELERYLEDEDFDIDRIATFNTDGFDLKGIPTGLAALRGDYVETPNEDIEDTKVKVLKDADVKTDDFEQLSLFTMINQASKKS